PQEAAKLPPGRPWLPAQHPPLALSDDAFDQRPIVTDLDLPQRDERSARQGQSFGRLLHIAQGRASECDQFPVKFNAVGPATCELDIAGALLGRAAMITPFQAGTAD